MIIEAIYKHVETGRISYLRQKTAEGDELYIRIIPNKNEESPFDECMFPFSKLAEFVAALNTVGVQVNDEEVEADAE